MTLKSTSAIGSDVRGASNLQSPKIARGRVHTISQTSQRRKHKDGEVIIGDDESPFNSFRQKNNHDLISVESITGSKSSSRHVTGRKVSNSAAMRTIQCTFERSDGVSKGKEHQQQIQKSARQHFLTVDHHLNAATGQQPMSKS